MLKSGRQVTRTKALDELVIASDNGVFPDYFEGTEQAVAPAAPAANKGRLYFRDNGAGKTQLVVRFATGAVVVVATQP